MTSQPQPKPGKSVENDLDEAVDTWVAQLRLGGPGAIRRTKEVLRRVPQMERGEAFAWTEQVSAAAFSSDEAAEESSAHEGHSHDGR